VSLVPGLVFLAWFIAFGRGGVATHLDPFTVTALASLPDFIWRGAGEALAAATGLGTAYRRVLPVVLIVVLVALILRRNPIPGRTVACFVTIVVEYAIVGLVRAQLEPDASRYTPYTYYSGILAMLGLVTLIGRSWPIRPRDRPVAAIGIASIAGLSFVWNVQLLIGGGGLQAERAELTRAFVELAETEPLPGGVPAERSLVTIPSPLDTRRIVVDYGSPLTDLVVPWAVREPTPTVRDEALRRARNPPAWLIGP
jgi:hypothetical protein